MIDFNVVSFRRVVLSGVLAAGVVAPASSQDAPATRTAVAGASFAKNGFHRFFFGTDYRRLWTTPATFEVLDLAKEAGGLSPVRRVGGQQTKGLAMKGKDGKNYTFRGIEKDASHILDADLRGTIVADLLQDQMAAQHPASEVIARVLLDAASVPCPGWRLVVMPDDPALGEYRKDFAGAIGAFAEYPSAVSATNPGFRGVSEIIDHAELYKRLEAGQGDVADVRALLRARLVDIFMGDWDRHRKQWRWAKFPSGPLWEPIPEDRDQAFSRYEGYVLDRGRARDPRFQNFGPRYAGIGGLTYNGWEQDRRLLAGLSRGAFTEEATSLKAAFQDAVLEKAARSMPPEWFAIDGGRLMADLKSRREGLPEIAARFYEHLADRVDVYMTNRPELVSAQRQTNGDLDVKVAVVQADGTAAAPYFERVFHRGETEEVRFYALGGDDKVTLRGASGGIKVRMIGGDGNDVLDASGAGNAKLSDSSGTNRAVDAALDARRYTPPPPPKNAPWIPPRDWTHETWTLPWLGYGRDLGVFLGGGIETVRYGFRRQPYSSEHTFRAGYSFGEQGVRVDYDGVYYRENRGSFFGLRAFGSGVEVFRFYGLGNGTTNTREQDFYRVKTDQFVLYPSFTLPFGGRSSLSVGPALKYMRSEERVDELVNEVKPYGVGRFGEIGLHGALVFDGRDSRVFPRKGAFLAARGTWYPKAWDVSKAFGETNATASAYISGGKRATLALRGGGKKVFGTYPFFEAASVGSGGLGEGALDEPQNTLRGFRSRRFQGDSSLYGSAELRLRVSPLKLILPGHFGVLGFVDTGRVWLAGEDSNTWHTGVGGGLFYSLLNDRSVFSVGVAHSKEDDLVYLKGGFTF
jgi:hypothetical protein